MYCRRLLCGLLLPALLSQLLTAQAVLQIRVVEGDGAVHIAGSRATRPLVVGITDEAGQPVAGAAVSFRLPESGPGGEFATGLKTEIVTTGPDGRAAVRGMRWSLTPGPFQIRITAAKGEARAGTIVEQHIETGTAKQTSSVSTRWVVVGLVVGAAAAGGLAFGLRGGESARGGGGSSPAPAPTIGTPTITVTAP